MDARLIDDDFVHEAKFAVENNIDRRTVARYRKMPDGLPFVEFGGRIFIHMPTAKRWLEARIHRPNPRRA
jgi:hypothetical protein